MNENPSLLTRWQLRDVITQISMQLSILQYHQMVRKELELKRDYYLPMPPPHTSVHEAKYDIDKAKSEVLDKIVRIYALDLTEGERAFAGTMHQLLLQNFARYVP